MRAALLFALLLACSASAMPANTTGRARRDLHVGQMQFGHRSHEEMMHLMRVREGRGRERRWLWRMCACVCVRVCVCVFV